MTRTVKLLFLMLLTGLSAESASPLPEFATGRACYGDGEFKKALMHFQLALRADPSDADSYYWIGRSYQRLADIAFPYTARYTSRARAYLTRATELAPGRLDYRRELFNLLLDSASSSRGALRQAADILQTASPNDPDYESMRWQYEQQSKDNASAGARLGRIFLALPEAASRIVDLAASSIQPHEGQVVR
jgi:tetratricopeptide (TPR) repeat protein